MAAAQEAAMAPVVKVGLLWYDGDAGRSWQEKVADASDRYEEKFGIKPDVCLVNVGTVGPLLPVHGRVRVVVTASILPDHFFVGVSES
jgi:hypothetical protein